MKIPTPNRDRFFSTLRLLKEQSLHFVKIVARSDVATTGEALHSERSHVVAEKTNY